MLEINDDKFIFKYNGKEIECRYPNALEVEKINEKLQNLEKGKELSSMRDLFINLGMPSEVVSALQVRHYLPIFEALVGKKN